MKTEAAIECFLRDSDNKIVNAKTKIKNDKKHSSENISISYNNILGKFKTNLCCNAKEFITSISNGIYILEKKVSPYKIDLTSAVIISQDLMQDKNSKEIDQEDEYDAYSLKNNNDLKTFVKNSAIRTSSGSVGFISDTEEFLLDPITKPLFVYMLDLFLGVTATAIENDLTETDRRKITGRAGSFRMKNNGVEYTVLGSWWIDTPEHIALVYSIAEFVYHGMIEKIWEKFWSVKVDDRVNYNCFGYNVDLIKNTINSCNKIEADKLLNFICNFMPNEIVMQINDMKKSASYVNYTRG